MKMKMIRMDEDTISRQAVLDCFHDWVDKYGDIHTPDEMAEYRAIEALPSAHSELEDKIRAIGYTGKEGRIYIGGRLFAVRELPQ